MDFVLKTAQSYGGTRNRDYKKSNKEEAADHGKMALEAFFDPQKRP